MSETSTREPDLNRLRDLVRQNQSSGETRPKDPNLQVSTDREGNLHVGRVTTGQAVSKVPQEVFSLRPIWDNHPTPLQQCDLIGDGERWFFEPHIVIRMTINPARKEETRQGAQCEAETSSEAWRVLLLGQMAQTRKERNNEI